MEAPALYRVLADQVFNLSRSPSGAWTEAQGSEQDLDESLGEQAAALLRNQRQGKQGWTKANETVSHGDTDSGSGTFIVVGKALFQ